jgi:hypothetical protein
MVFPAQLLIDLYWILQSKYFINENNQKLQEAKSRSNAYLRILPFVFPLETIHIQKYTQFI